MSAFALSFLLEFEMEDAADVALPVSLDDMPWVIEDQIVGESSDGENDATAVAPRSASPVATLPNCTLPNATRDLVMQWDGTALAKAKTVWDTLSPELERIAAETLAKASLVEPATTQR